VFDNWRAALVNTKMISAAATRLGFNDFLLLSKGEAKEEGKARQCILANTFEAFIGALYLDAGIEKCRAFIVSNLVSQLGEIVENSCTKTPSRVFRKWCRNV